MSGCGSGTCVDVTEHSDGAVTLTSTVPGNDGTVTYTRGEWEVFLRRVKAGEFDALEVAA